MLEFDDYCSRIIRALKIPAAGDPTPEMNLYEELNVDSLQAFELIVLTEQLAGLFVPPPDIPELYTLGDAYGYYALVSQLAEESDLP